MTKETIYQVMIAILTTLVVILLAIMENQRKEYLEIINRKINTVVYVPDSTDRKAE
ncbi:hypothetical protein [Streptococcus sp. sy004]|uniref:hypothetical protein n=1 Tax=Streptococcus sp. sy004 TaxID=2600149 RepID=UPI001648834F|nr:hypothetical protein [Streptococcus sp. sy004]